MSDSAICLICFKLPFLSDLPGPFSLPFGTPNSSSAKFSLSSDSSLVVHAFFLSQTPGISLVILLCSVSLTKRGNLICLPCLSLIFMGDCISSFFKKKMCMPSDSIFYFPTFFSHLHFFQSLLLIDDLITWFTIFSLPAFSVIILSDFQYPSVIYPKS